MKHGSELDENTTQLPAAEAEPARGRHVEPLARIGRFFRGPMGVAGELPPGDDGVSTAEYNVLDLRGAAFPIALWGGYDRDAVDERIAGLEEELEELRAKVDPEVGVQVEIQQLGDETAEILRVAHGKADAMVKKAEADAAIMIAKTQEQAATMIADAEEHVRRLDHDTDVIWAERTRLTEDTKRLGEQLTRLAESAAERFPPEAATGDG